MKMSYSGSDLVKLKRDDEYKNCKEHIYRVKTIINDKLLQENNVKRL